MGVDQRGAAWSVLHAFHTACCAQMCASMVMRVLEQGGHRVDRVYGSFPDDVLVQKMA